jgi:tetratricopeptide (TPR) repeat protein
MIARAIVAVAAAALLATQAVRNAAVASLAETRPLMAAGFWSTHPSVEISLAMTGIAHAAHDRHAVPASTFPLMADAALKEPLAPEPYLVRGVQAQLAGDDLTAQRAFEAAQWRDPRSLPAAYFLADRYLRIGDVRRGLNEVAALARLSPNGAGLLAPYLAAYARSPANWPALRTMFRANPGLAHPAMVALASDIATVPAVLALADPGENPQRAQWLPQLLNTLTDAGQYAKARAIWSRASRSIANELVHDASFNDKSAPPPFNWSLTSSAVGLAERQPGGRLHVLFYGQEDGILASQLLLLQPGPYRLSLQLLGDPVRAKALNWSIWCDKASGPIASVTLDGAARGWRFDVPQGCTAQWLKLSGSSGDISQQVDTTIAALKLEREGAGA